MDDGWQRRHAVQVTAMLPENTGDALLVLELAMELVTGFLSGTQPLIGVVERKRCSMSNGKALSSP